MGHKKTIHRVLTQQNSYLLKACKVLVWQSAQSVIITIGNWKMSIRSPAYRTFRNYFQFSLSSEKRLQKTLHLYSILAGHCTRVYSWKRTFQFLDWSQFQVDVPYLGRFSFQFQNLLNFFLKRNSPIGTRRAWSQQREASVPKWNCVGNSRFRIDLKWWPS